MLNRRGVLIGLGAGAAVMVTACLDQADVITVYLIVNDTDVSVSPSAAATL